MELPRIVFVCTGNTCRSVMARYLLEGGLRRRLGENRIPVEVDSAGLHSLEGEPATPHTLQVLSELGYDASAHKSKRLTPEDINGADLVLTMTRAHKEAVLDMVPAAADKVFTLREYVASATGRGMPAKEDIDDPAGGDEQVYRMCRDEINDEVQALVELLAKKYGPEKEGRDTKVLVGIGCDHAGYPLKKAVIAYFQEAGIAFRDYGTYSEDPVDYPDFGLQVAQAVARGDCQFGVLICGTGIGMSITANKVRHVRAALCTEPVSARLARQHNDANVLAMGGRLTGPVMAVEIVKAFLATGFEGGRHKRRLDKISALEEGQS